MPTSLKAHTIDSSVNFWHANNLLNLLGKRGALTQINRFTAKAAGLRQTLRDQVADVRGHRREHRLAVTRDVLRRDAHLLALAVRDHQHLALHAQHQARNALLVVGEDDAGAERLIDVPVRVDHVFEDALQPAVADAVELRRDLAALLADPVARGAVLGKELRPEFLVGLGGGVLRRALLDELGEPLVERRQPLRQLGLWRAYRPPLRLHHSHAGRRSVPGRDGLQHRLADA